MRVEVRDAAAADLVTWRYSVPLFLPSSDSRRHGFVRLVNRSDEAGPVTIHAFDDAGERHGPAEVNMAARETVHFNSEDLESGNPDKGITGSIGAGTGNWRLELTTRLDIAPLAYVRTEDGFLPVCTTPPGPSTTGAITFHSSIRPPTRGRSVLCAWSTRTEDAAITITGIDDKGRAAPGRGGKAESPGRAVRARSRRCSSNPAAMPCRGQFGSGSGKWRLFLSATSPIQVSSLLDSPTGNLSNLSSRGRERSLPLVLPVTNDGRQAFVRIINWSDAPGSVRIRGLTDSGRQTDAITLTLEAGAAAHFNSWDLQFGNEAKGLSGGIGHGHGGGNWRLELQSDLDIEALAFVRTDDGFVTGVHDLAVQVEGLVDVPFFNPAGNTNQKAGCSWSIRARTTRWRPSRVGTTAGPCRHTEKCA